MSPTVGNILQTPQYQTQLTPPQQLQYQQWKSSLPTNLQNDTDYDLRGAFLAGLNPAKNGHLPDDYKKPNHMTFSDQSKYNGVNGNYGGKWVQDPTSQKWTFYASPTNLKYHSASDLQSYFKNYEPDSKLVLPQTQIAPQATLPPQNVIQPVNPITSILQGLFK